METKEGINPEYIPESSLETVVISPDKLDKLDELQERFLLFYDLEMKRLKTERAFLQSVIDSASYGAASLKSNWIKGQVVIEDVKLLLKLAAG